MSLFRYSVLILALAVLNPINLFSAKDQDDISVKVEVDKAFATIGDEINFRVTVRHHPDISVLELNAQEVLSDFEIKKTTDFSTKENKEIVGGKNYVITSYSLGEYVIRPFKIQYRTKDGAVKQIETNTLYLTLESVDKSKNPESDIRGVKGVKKLKNPVLIWILSFILISAAMAAGIWFYDFRKRRKAQGPQKEPLLSPHEEAYLGLNQLKHSDLIRKGLVKEYFFQMSEIIRRYLERRFLIRALESTTFELMEELQSKINQEQTQLVKDVLSFCDLVKFAKYTPSPLEIIEQSNQAKLIIDQTKEELQPALPETVKST